MTGIIVLARLVTPEQFGLVAMIVVFVGLGEMLRDFGLSNAAIQAKILTTPQRDALCEAP